MPVVYIVLGWVGLAMTVLGITNTINDAIKKRQVSAHTVLMAAGGAAVLAASLGYLLALDFAKM